MAWRPGSGREPRRQGVDFSALPASAHRLLACLCCTLALWTPGKAVLLQGTLTQYIQNVTTYCTGFGANSTTEIEVQYIAGTFDCPGFRILSISLSGDKLNNAGQPIPASISGIVSLTSLELTGINAGSLLPSELGLLTNLQSLSIPNSNLRGSLPDSFTSLTRLTSLNLSGNALAGPLPRLLTTMTNLLDLNLGNNDFTGSLPDVFFYNLNSLTSLNLTQNDFEGSSLGGFSLFQALQTLDLSNNMFSGSFPTSLSVLTTLKIVSLSRNRFSGALPPFLSTVSWNFLNVSRNSFTGLLPQFSSLQSFTDLDLSQNLLYGALVDPSGYLCGDPSIGFRVNLTANCFTYLPCAGPDGIYYQIPHQGSIGSSICNATCANASAPEICSNPLAAVIDATLAFCNAGFTAAPGVACLLRRPLMLETGGLSSAAVRFTNRGLPFPTSIASLPSLVALSTNAAEISGTIPPAISTMRALVYLSLRDNLLGGPVPGWLSTLQALTELDLSGNSFTGTLPSVLGNMINLNIMTLQSNRLSGTIPFPVIALPKVVKMDLGNNKLTGIVPLPLPTLRLVAQGQIAFAGNFLLDLDAVQGFAGVNVSGSCSAFQAATSLNCFYSNSSAAVALGCPLASQQPDDICRGFCDTTGSLGACSGVGTCFQNDTTAAPTCSCITGYNIDPNFPGACKRASFPGLPAPTSPGRGALGLNQSVPLPPTQPFLNSWSRHLSRGWQPENGSRPAWGFDTTVDWISQPNQFYPRSGIYPPFVWGNASNLGPCRSAWAVATAENVAGAVSLASNAMGLIPQLAVDYLGNCSSESSGDSGCSGNVPAAALNRTAYFGLFEAGSYTRHATCPAFEFPDFNPYKIAMYETIHYGGWLGLLLTLTAQPAIVSLQASYPGFQNWTTNRNGSNVFLDEACYSGNLDHTVQVVGYQLNYYQPYWILRNSWGAQWGDRGYIRLGIFSSISPGICGIYTYPALYAVPASVDACYSNSFRSPYRNLSTLNPCGGGSCTAEPTWGNRSYSCSCPGGFIAVNNSAGPGGDVTQTCAPADPCSFSLFLPCGTGACRSDARGGYSCDCPPGFAESRVTRRPTCIPLLNAPDFSSQRAPNTVMVPPGGMSCVAAARAFGLSLRQLQGRNTGLNCTQSIPEGTVLAVTNSPYAWCAQWYKTTVNDSSCSAISSWLGVPASTLQAANPTGLNCTLPVPPGLPICVRQGLPAPLYPCLRQQRLRPWDTCASLAAAKFRSRLEGPVLLTPGLNFLALNPGINCGNLPLGIVPMGRLRGDFFVCLARGDPQTASCASGRYYTTQHGDSCSSLLNRGILARMDQIPALACVGNDLTPGMQLCLPGAAPATPQLAGTARV